MQGSNQVAKINSVIGHISKLNNQNSPNSLHVLYPSLTVENNSKINLNTFSRNVENDMGNFTRAKYARCISLMNTSRENLSKSNFICIVYAAISAWKLLNSLLLLPPDLGDAVSLLNPRDPYVSGGVFSWLKLLRAAGYVNADGKTLNNMTNRYNKDLGKFFSYKISQKFRVYFGCFFVCTDPTGLAFSDKL